MTLIELIGFVITFVALIFIFFKRVFEERAMKKNPELYAERERQHQEALKKFYKTMRVESLDEEKEEEEEFEEEEHPRLLEINRRHTKAQAPSSTIQQPKKQPPPLQKPQTVHPAYEVIRESRNSRGIDILNKLPRKQDMLILKEIFDKPLAMRDPRD